MYMENGSIVVFGGSFNPPTVAHFATMQAAMEAVNAYKGIFIPTAAKNLRRKMSRAGYPEECFSQEDRTAMLMAMAREDPRFSMEDLEYRKPKMQSSYRVCEYIQKKYPGDRVYYLIGSDNVELFLSSFFVEDFLERFGYVVIRRSGDNVEEKLREHPVARMHMDKFTILTPETVIQNISSTRVRDCIRRTDREGMRPMLHPEVYKIMEDMTYETDYSKTGA